MTGTDPALSHLAESLAATVETADSAGLSQYLSGRKLPAMGGDLDPADILLQTLPLIQQPPDFPNRLARVLASVIEKEASTLENVETRSSRRHNTALQNALYLAAELPAEEALFTSLKRFLKVLRAIPKEDEGISKLQLPLWQALAYQQTDASLEAEWLSILESSESASRSPERQTLLLTAWRGLLWIPPGPEKRESGEIVDLERIERGFLAFYSEESSPLLGTCLDILEETYPRSAEFWKKTIHLRATNWPAELRNLVFDRWRVEQVGSRDYRAEVEELGRALNHFLQYHLRVHHIQADTARAVSESIAAMERAARLMQESMPRSSYEEELEQLNRRFEELREAAAALRDEVAQERIDTTSLNQLLRKVS